MHHYCQILDRELKLDAINAILKFMILQNKSKLHEYASQITSSFSTCFENLENIY